MGRSNCTSRGVVVEKAEKAQTKNDRKAFCKDAATERREALKMRAAQKKLRKELCKKVKMKAKARVNSEEGI